MFYLGLQSTYFSWSFFLMIWVDAMFKESEIRSWERSATLDKNVAAFLVIMRNLRASQQHVYKIPFDKNW